MLFVQCSLLLDLNWNNAFCICIHSESVIMSLSSRENFCHALQFLLGLKSELYFRIPDEYSIIHSRLFNLCFKKKPRSWIIASWIDSITCQKGPRYFITFITITLQRFKHREKSFFIVVIMRMNCREATADEPEEAHASGVSKRTPRSASTDLLGSGGSKKDSPVEKKSHFNTLKAWGRSRLKLISPKTSQQNHAVSAVDLRLCSISSGNEDLTT